MSIQSSAEWWSEIEQNWDELVALFRGCKLDGQIGELERMKKLRDARIARRLLAAKKRAPSRRERRRSYGWQVLFDLCAEQWVLYQPIAIS